MSENDDNAKGKTPLAVVLVVDDERQIVSLLKDLLEDEGYAVRLAYDGAAALDEINAAKPDLVLSDVMMPRLDGLALYDEIRRRVADLPVILMSAAVRPKAIDAAFVPKPFDIDHLLDVVDAQLRKSS